MISDDVDGDRLQLKKIGPLGGLAGIAILAVDEDLVVGLEMGEFYGHA
jgi:hypothetical protein